MNRKTSFFKSQKLFASIAPFSHIASFDGIGFISGIVGQVPETGQLIAKDFDSQCDQTFKNLATLLNEKNLSTSDVIKLTCYFSSLSYFEQANTIQQKYFTETNPARVCLAVKELPLDALFQLEAIVVFDLEK